MKKVPLEQRRNLRHNEIRRALIGDLAFQQRKTTEEKRGLHLLKPQVKINKKLDSPSYSQWKLRFPESEKGLICLYPTKNIIHPEYSFITELGVMSLDFHPSSPALLAISLYSF